MTEIGFTYWQDGGDWLGYLDEFPDYLTQGESLSDLQSHLVDLQRELLSGAIPSLIKNSRVSVSRNRGEKSPAHAGSRNRGTLTPILYSFASLAALA